MKKRALFFGIAVFAAIVALTFSLLSCGEEKEEETGPSIPSLSAPKPANLADISGATAPTIKTDEQAVEFLTSAFSSIGANMPDLDVFGSIMEDIIGQLPIGIGGGSDEPDYNQRATLTLSDKININFSDYTDQLKNTGVTLTGKINGSYSMTSTEGKNSYSNSSSVNGNVNADCSLNYDISKNKDVNTDDIFVMDVKFKANGSMSISAKTAITWDGDYVTTGNVSFSAGASVTLAMAYKNKETNEGAKIILTAGFAGSDSMKLNSETAIPNLGKFSGNATLTIYDADNKKIYSKKMTLDQIIEQISVISEEWSEPDYDDDYYDYY